MWWIQLHFLLIQILSALANETFQSLYELIQSGQWEPEEISYKKYDLNIIFDLMKSRMDESIEPCTDFYNYVCGNWDESKDDLLNAHMITRSHIIDTMRDILENQTSHLDNFKLSMEKEFYMSCMDTGKSLKEGFKLFMKIVSYNKRKSWQEAIKYYATKVGEILLFRISLSVENVLQILRPYASHSNIKYKELTRPLRISEYDIHAINTLNNNLASEELKNLTKIVNELLHAPPSSLEQMSISQFQNIFDKYCPSKTGKIDWLKLLKKLAGKRNVKLTSSDPIQFDLKYIMSLCKVLQDIPNHRIVTYLHYTFLMDLKTPLIISKENDTKFSTNKRSVFCIDKIPINEGLNDEIVDYYIPHKNQEMVNTMFKMLKNELLTAIKDSWLEPEAIELITEHAQKIKFKFNIVHDAISTKKMQQSSYNFNITSVALQNEINFKKAQIKHKLKIYIRSLAQRRQKRDVVVNAVYEQTHNVLYLSPGLMLPVIFHPEAPAAYNFGMLGFVIAHELCHAFDFGGCTRCFKRSYLTDEVSLIFKKKMQCFKDQFNAFNINGTKTLDENVADTQGLKLIFKAMKKFIKANIIEKTRTLPGFEKFNAKKLFFISFANQWCTNPKNNIYKGNVHAPHAFRVKGTLMNMKEFADTFSCRRQDPMNSVEKCDLWKNTNKRKPFWKRMFQRRLQDPQNE